MPQTQGAGAGCAAMADASVDALVPFLDAAPLAVAGGGRAGLSKRLASGGTPLGVPLGSHSPPGGSESGKWWGDMALGAELRPCLRGRGSFGCR